MIQILSLNLIVCKLFVSIENSNEELFIPLSVLHLYSKVKYITVLIKNMTLNIFENNTFIVHFKSDYKFTILSD